MNYKNKDIAIEFDRLSNLDDEQWNKSQLFYKEILSLVHAGANALDIGCGKGELTRLIATKANSVLGVDLSPAMIASAKAYTTNLQNTNYLHADFVAFDFGERKFDFIVSIATLHHLPFSRSLGKIKDLLLPGGQLFILDLHEVPGVGGFVYNGKNLIFESFLNLLTHHKFRAPKQVRDAWHEHRSFDHFMTINQVRTLAAEVLPEAEIRKRSLWRYSLYWRKSVHD